MGLVQRFNTDHSDEHHLKQAIDLRNERRPRELQLIESFCQESRTVDEANIIIPPEKIKTVGAINGEEYNRSSTYEHSKFSNEMVSFRPEPDRNDIKLELTMSVSAGQFQPAIYGFLVLDCHTFFGVKSLLTSLQTQFYAY